MRSLTQGEIDLSDVISRAPIKWTPVVKVENGDATMVDVGDLLGRDWLVSVEWGEGIDDAVGTARIDLAREQSATSLAPLVGSSRLNLSVSGDPLLALGRRVTIGLTGDPAGVLEKVFEGTIVALDWTGETIKIDCDDLSGILQRAYLEHDLIVAGSLDTGLAEGGVALWPWQPDFDLENEFGIGTVIHCLRSAPTDECVTFARTIAAGDVTGSVEPTWPGTGTVVDNTITWNAAAKTYRVAGAPIVDACTHLLRSPVMVPATENENPWVLYCDDPPDWIVLPYICDRKSVLAAVQELADMIGWSVRQKFHSGSGDFHTQLFEIDRAATTPDFVFGPDRYFSIDEMRTDLEMIRNVISVVYSDSTTLASNGVDYVRKRITVSDTDSISKHGRLYAEISEASTGGINTAIEADDLADRVLSDLSEPTCSHAVSMPLWPFAELGDLYTLSANRIHYDSDLTLAVTTIKHRVTADAQVTTLGFRGKPSGGAVRWLTKVSTPGGAPATVRNIRPPASVSNIQMIVPGDRQWRVEITVFPDCIWDEVEVYARDSYPTTGPFAPSSATLRYRGRSLTPTWELLTTTPWMEAMVLLRDSHGNASTPVYTIYD